MTQGAAAAKIYECAKNALEKVNSVELFGAYSFGGQGLECLKIFCRYWLSAQITVRVDFRVMS